MAATSERPAQFVLARYWLSLLGVALLATAVISWLFVLPQQVRGHVENPYAGILVFLILPAIVFAGLALVLVGACLSERQIRRGPSEEGTSNKQLKNSRGNKGFAYARYKKGNGTTGRS
jgi:hypothetical protein